MHFSNRDLLMTLYCFITIVGIILLVFAWYVWQQSETAQEPFSYWIAAIVLFIVGIVLIMFGIETYIERDDPDVWL
jgi:uncharacterized membrane protein